jgi:hypothetical protein
VKEAETALKEATDDDNLRPTDRGAAHLHLSRLYTAIGQPFQSAIHFDRAKPLVAQSEHGWVKDLLTTTEKGLKGDTGPELRINIQDLISLARDHQEGPWDYISKFLDIDVKRRLLSLPKYQGYLEEKNGDGRVAEELGISRGTLFNWKKQPELKDLFYIASRRKERSEQ